MRWMLRRHSCSSKAGVALQAARKGGNDLVLAQTGTARAAHGEDEGETELGVVVRIELLNLGELLRRAIGQARLVLFIGGLSGQRFAHHGFAGQLGVGAYQRELGVGARRLQHAHHGVLELGQDWKGRCASACSAIQVECSYRPVQHLGGLRQWRVVEVLQGQGRHSQSLWSGGLTPLKS